jgi:ribosomal protein L32
MEMVMCRSCGEFTPASKEDGTFVPLADECPSCGGMEFKHNGNETVIRTGE